jgi:tetratricopeptide (TPR) repeat protein
MRISRKAWGLAAVAALGIAPRAVRAQSGDTVGAAYLRGQDLETRDQYDSAATAYRQALVQTPTSLPAMLGLERVYAQLGRSDSLLPVLDSAIARQPHSSALRAAQLRTFRSLGDRAGLQRAYDAWRRDVPHDPAPYQAYARMLIEDGYTAQADTVLQQGESDAGGGRGFSYEVAQLDAAMGKWEPSAHAWRQAVADNAYLADAAVFALFPTPNGTRDAVRRALAMPPVSTPALKVLGALELAWGSPREGWTALHVLRPDSATLVAWVDFARRAEQANAWLVARDALVAADHADPDPGYVVRAANDALAGGDAAGAAALAARAESDLDSAAAATTALPVHLRALSTLGKPAEGDKLLAAYAGALSADERAQYARLLAWGWVRVGDLDRARQALAASGGGDDAAAGWIALYQGDLASARSQLHGQGDASGDVLAVLALLDRTRATKSPALGTAYLTLARGDTAGAAADFAAAAPVLSDAGSLLLATSARLYTAHGDAPQAIATWKTIVDSLPQSPEAPEADLEWARILRRTKQNPEAIARLEHLIITYPQSALVPQARRELDLARQTVPSTS